MGCTIERHLEKLRGVQTVKIRTFGSGDGEEFAGPAIPPVLSGVQTGDSRVNFVPTALLMADDPGGLVNMHDAYLTKH